MTTVKAKRFSWLLVLFASASVFFASCTKDGPYNVPVLTGVISYYNEFGAAMFDFTEAFSGYLLSHGMSRAQLDALTGALTTLLP